MSLAYPSPFSEVLQENFLRTAVDEFCLDVSSASGAVREATVRPFFKLYTLVPTISLILSGTQILLPLFPKSSSPKPLTSRLPCP